ncbi:MAG: TraX family protein [Faecousia sp.]
MEVKMVSARKYLNRDVIKYIAMLTMLLNHISIIFMKSGNFLSELFLDIGYFTAITMCYFLVEGFQYTRSKKNYAIRLLIFAFISEIPYCMAFTKNGVLEIHGLNMLFTLLICFVILIVNERVLNKFLKYICILGLTLLSLFCDWALLAPIFTLLFIWSRGSRNKIKCTFIISMLLFGIEKIFTGGIGRFSISTNIVYALGSMSGIALAGIVILYFYNGKRMDKGKVFSKWFFYLFYPVHLLILGLIRIYSL